jgi:hypothetical protein
MTACSILLAGPRASAQSAVAPGGQLQMNKADLPTAINQPPDPNAQERSRARRLRQLKFDAVNAARIRQIADETGRLLLLARDLQTQLDRMGAKPLPSLLIREAEVIEKIAHDVQARMTVTVGAG